MQLSDMSLSILTLKPCNSYSGFFMFTGLKTQRTNILSARNNVIVAVEGMFLQILMRMLFLALMLDLSYVKAESDFDTYRDFNIPAQSADVALKLFAQQAEIQFLFPYEVAIEYVTNSVRGRYTPEEALQRLLNGTAIKALFTEKGDLTIQVEKQDGGGEKVQIKPSVYSKLSAVLFSTLLAQGTSAQDTATGVRALEEIVVTAQRREQSLQEVPISLEVFSGDDIFRQGYEDLTSLQSFTPNLYLESNARNSDIMIRGTGTLGANLGFEQAVPVFADGVHYGRGSQITNAFLDIERVEILRGPQPVYFGQNATAGAISMVTRKPGTEWGGYVNAEYGNDNRRMGEVAAGGPVTDTFGIRVAGKYFETDGHLSDVWSGQKFPNKSQVVGRVSLQWTPTDSFLVNAKMEYMEVELGGMDEVFILTDGEVSCQSMAGFCAVEPSNQVVFGIGSALSVPSGPDFTSVGSFSGSPYWEAEPGFNLRRDGRATANLFPLVLNPPSDIDLGRSDLDYTPRENIKPFVAVIDADYTFRNGITLTSQTAYSYFDRFARVNHTDNGPFVMRKLDGWEEMDQYSQELRLSSPGGNFIEWMTGLYWQMQNLDTHYVSLFSRIQGGGAMKEAISSQDGIWTSGFVSFVFNFTDQISLDAGVRYTDVSKTGNIIPYQAEWICEGGACVFQIRQGIRDRLPLA